MVQVEVLYQWNRLEEARIRLHTLLRDAAAWQQLDVLGWGYFMQIRGALARGAESEAQQALDEMEQLAQRERFGSATAHFPTIRAICWLAQGQLKEALDWAAEITAPQRTWDVGLYGLSDAHLAATRVYFAVQRWDEALELLERWSDYLDRPANIAVTITFLAQSLVALHQTGKSEQADIIAERLLALTEPEGHLRVYLDEGEPMRQALMAWLTTHAQLPPQAASARAYVSRLLAAFEQERHSTNSIPTPASSPPARTLTRREQDVLRLLAEGASNQEIAQALVISLDTVKKHVSNLFRKLGVTSRAQVIVRARTRSLL